MQPSSEEAPVFLLARGSCYVLSFPFGWLHAYWCVCVYACMYVRRYECVCVCVYVRMCVCMYVCMYVMSCTYSVLVLIIGSKEILSIEICVPQLRLSIISYRCML